jgi:hypothetical protein
MSNNLSRFETPFKFLKILISLFFLVSTGFKTLITTLFSLLALMPSYISEDFPLFILFIISQSSCFIHVLSNYLLLDYSRGNILFRISGLKIQKILKKFIKIHF